MQQRTHDHGRDFNISPMIAALSSATSKLLDAPVRESTHGILVAHGMPRDEKATIGLVVEMALSPDLPILQGASQRHRALWSHWGARLELCHGSTAYPGNTPSRSDLDLLAESAKIAHSIQECAKRDTRSMLSQAFARELAEHESEFAELSRLAVEARQRIAA
jgi:cytochrome c553